MRVVSHSLPAGSLNRRTRGHFRAWDHSGRCSCCGDASRRPGSEWRGTWWSSLRASPARWTGSSPACHLMWWFSQLSYWMFKQPKLTSQFFHDHKNSFWGLKHSLEINDSWMMEILQDSDFVLERGLLLGGEPHLINDFNCNSTTRYPINRRQL